jgi:hypothetical protein
MPCKRFNGIIGVGLRDGVNGEAKKVEGAYNQ